MTETTENLVLKHLHYIMCKVDSIDSKVDLLTLRVSRIELTLASMRGNPMNQRQESFNGLLNVGFTELQAMELIDVIYEIFRFNVPERTEKLIAAGFTEQQAKGFIEVVYKAKGWELPYPLTSFP
jgi:hypothetical protein